MAGRLTVETQNVPSLKISSTLRIEGHNFVFGTEDFRFLSNETIQAGAKDVVVRGDLAYVAVGYTGVAIVDCSRSGTLRLLSRIPTGGNATEIAVNLPYLYVADRPAGVAVIDAADPEHPRLVRYHDSVEFATGIDVSEGIMAVCNRPHGLEICDVSDPSRPVFLGEVSVGEAQGVRIRGRYAYAGIWKDSRVAVVDIADPANPVHVSDVPLEGFGWGMAVGGSGDGLLAVATGHHNDRGHGRGHGLEVMRLSDEGQARTVFRVDTPPYYRRTNDWWRVRFHGNLLLHADGLNGVLVYDCSDPEELRVLGRVESFDYAGGAAVTGDSLLVADMRSGVHLAELPAPSRAALSTASESKPATVKPVRSSAGRAPRTDIVYRTEGSVRRIAGYGRLLVTASGSSGIEILDPSGGGARKVSAVTTPGPATDLVVRGPRAWAALRGGGAAAIDLSTAAEPRIAVHRDGRPLYLIEISGDWVLCLRGEGGVELFRKDDLEPIRVSAVVPFFPTQLAPWDGGIMALSGDEAAVLSVSDRGAVTKLPVMLSDGKSVRPLKGAQGVAIHGRRLVVYHEGKLSLLEAAVTSGDLSLAPAVVLSPITSTPVTGVRRGLVSWDGTLGVVCDPFTGGVTTFRSGADALSVAGTRTLPGHPGRALLAGGRAFVPCGHAGIAAVDLD